MSRSGIALLWGIIVFSMCVFPPYTCGSYDFIFERPGGAINWPHLALQITGVTALAVGLMYRFAAKR